MHSPMCPNWFGGALIVFVAALVIWRGVELWRDPDSLQPDSWAYQMCLRRLRQYRPDLVGKRTQSYRTPRRYDDWQRARQSKEWKDRPPVVTLTREDVQALGIDRVLAGVFLLVVGIVVVFISWPS